MSGFNKKSAERISKVVKRVERTAYGVDTSRRGSNVRQDVIFFKLNENLVKSINTTLEAVAVRGTVYGPDPLNPTQHTSDTVYVPQELVVGEPPRVEWLVSRSLDFSASAQTSGIAHWVNGEWLIVWIDCTQDFQ